MTEGKLLWVLHLDDEFVLQFQLFDCVAGLVIHEIWIDDGTNCAAVFNSRGYEL